MKPHIVELGNRKNLVTLRFDDKDNIFITWNGDGWNVVINDEVIKSFDSKEDATDFAFDCFNKAASDYLVQQGFSRSIQVAGSYRKKIKELENKSRHELIKIVTDMLNGCVSFDF